MTTSGANAPFAILPPSGPERPIVAHIPHASTIIPPDVRQGITLDDAGLATELVRMTDWHVDRLFAWTADLGATRFVNGRSRLVVDPERFEDDALESMARVGQGAVYVRTTDGRPLRDPDPAERRRLIDAVFRPYHAAVTALVGRLLEVHGRCLILDCHSFPSEPRPWEPDQLPDRPDICLGTDATHTPPELASALAERFTAEGFRVAFDTPFAGCFVPLAWYGHDRRVASVMIEVRRGLYCDESTGEPLPTFGAVAARLARAVGGALEGKDGPRASRTPMARW